MKIPYDLSYVETAIPNQQTGHVYDAIYE